jgi:Ca-activated chloride channel family protein
MKRTTVGLCAGLTLTILTAIVRSQQPVFTSKVEAVRVDVAVTRSGRPIAGLRPIDFELRDSGVVQQITLLSTESLPLNLVLAFDVSFSVRGEPLQRLKEAAHAAVAELAPNDSVALVTFSQILKRPFSFSTRSADLDEAIDALTADGATALNDATFAAMGLRAHLDGRMLVLLFTDGSDTVSWLSPLAVIDRARRTDVVVEAVLLNQPATRLPSLNGGPLVPAQGRRWFNDEPQLFRREFIPALVDETGGQVIVTDRSQDLRQLFLTILSEFRSRYVITYTPTNVPAAAWHPIDVRLKNVQGEVRARRGYGR